jgi:hypothetical protein
MSRQLRLTTALCGLALCVGSNLAAAAEGDEESRESQRASRLKVMHELVEGVKMRSGEAGELADLELVPDPVFRYADAPHESLEDATVWIWRRGERPVVLLKLEFYPRLRQQPTWSFGCCSATGSPVDAQFESGRTWSTTLPGGAPAWLPESGTPADDAETRLRQLREIARRFTAYRRYGELGRTELRLLTRAIYRYKSEPDGIIDGALFCVAKDTNPHIFLLIEAVKDGESRRWRYTAVRNADAECHLLLDEQEVWQADERVAIDPRQPYFWFQMSALTAGDAKPDRPVSGQ